MKFDLKSVRGGGGWGKKWRTERGRQERKRRILS